MIAPISKSQIKIIHCLKSALRLNDGDYRVLLASYQVQSSKDLDSSRARDLIERMEAQAVKTGSWSHQEVQKPQQRPGMATEAQIKKIRAMWSQVSRSADKQAALRSFVSSHFHIDRLEWVPIEIVPKIIKAIGSMPKLEVQYGGRNNNNQSVPACDSSGCAAR